MQHRSATRLRRLETGDIVGPPRLAAREAGVMGRRSVAGVTGCLAALAVLAVLPASAQAGVYLNIPITSSQAAIGYSGQGTERNQVTVSGGSGGRTMTIQDRGVLLPLPDLIGGL